MDPTEKFIQVQTRQLRYRYRSLNGVIVIEFRQFGMRRDMAGYGGDRSGSSGTISVQHYELR